MAPICGPYFKAENIKPEFSIITHYPENDKWQLLEKPLTLEEFNNSQFIKPIWFKIGFTEIPNFYAECSA